MDSYQILRSDIAEHQLTRRPSILKAIALKASILFINKAVWGTLLRPDLVVQKGKHIFLVDVTSAPR
ncbi:hypothetical protein CEXT_720641 [Caerostris extrusa]|uniref:Uncharacterized protein n=1 Tax=Caerostris extrusa TaxID=172846 RepID=A0AAV4QXP6_CAEEX|nr:hypothetical protein CEXT_720641 [Caerostris extrusa]